MQRINLFFRHIGYSRCSMVGVILQVKSAALKYNTQGKVIYSITECAFSIPNVNNFLCEFKTSTQSYYYRPDCFTPKWHVLSLCCMWCRSRKFVLIISLSASQPAPFWQLLCPLSCAAAKSELLVLFTPCLQNVYLFLLFFEPFFFHCNDDE